MVRSKSTLDTEELAGVVSPACVSPVCEFTVKMVGFLTQESLQDSSQLRNRGSRNLTVTSGWWRLSDGEMSSACGAGEWGERSGTHLCSGPRGLCPSL